MLLASPWKVPLLFVCYFIIKDCGCTEEICIRALPPFYSELSISWRSNNYLPWYLALNDYLSFVWQTHSKICITGADRASEETSRDGREDTSWFTGGTLSLRLLWMLISYSIWVTVSIQYLYLSRLQYKVWSFLIPKGNIILLLTTIFCYRLFEMGPKSALLCDIIFEIHILDTINIGI